MPGEFLCTLGAPSQLSTLLKRGYLHGKSEPRVAMVGRSNVGKSSLMNALLERKLAQVSSSPGKTRLIHFYFLPAAECILADLPGYGFARAEKSERTRWEQLIAAYLEADTELRLGLVLLDSRHGPTPADLDAIRFLCAQNVDILPVFTKTDALKTQSDRARRKKDGLAAVRAELGDECREPIWTSSDTNAGVDRLITVLKEVSLEFKKQGTGGADGE